MGLEAVPGTGTTPRARACRKRIDLLLMQSNDEVASFIRTTFRSVWARELPCFLRQNRDGSLSHAQMVAELRGSDLVVTPSIAALAAGGLIVTEAAGSARYAPATG